MTGDDTDESPSRSEVYEHLEPLEPYTTEEVASLLDRPKKLVFRLLDALYEADEVQKKETESGPVIWIRDAPKYECADCGHEFEVQFLHAVLSSARYCPRCGNRLE